MSQPSSKLGMRIIIGSVALVVIGAAYIGYSGYSNKLESHQETSVEAMLQPAAGAAHAHEHNHNQAPAKPVDAKAAAKLLAITANDIVIGNPKAPNIITEYASLSCPHCADFHLNVLPAIKKELVDTGEAVLVFRHFPLNAPAMRAAMAVQCAPKNVRADLLAHYFKTQKDWAFSSRYGVLIAEIAKKHGITRQAFDTCMKDTALENAVLQSRQDAATVLNVQATPTLLINGVALSGKYDMATIQKAVEESVKATPGT